MSERIIYEEKAVFCASVGRLASLLVSIYDDALAKVCQLTTVRIAHKCNSQYSVVVQLNSHPPDLINGVHPLNNDTNQSTEGCQEVINGIRMHEDALHYVPKDSGCGTIESSRNIILLAKELSINDLEQGDRNLTSTILGKGSVQ